MSYDVAIIGGGAVGFYCTAQIRTVNAEVKIIILEKSRRTLEKVRISGGGRCNVTHACFTPKDLVRFYPRGEKELLGPFHHHAPGDVMGWFDDQGVPLKIEEDGRVFPVSDTSKSIISALESKALSGETLLETRVSLKEINRSEEGWNLVSSNGDCMHAKKIVFCTGSNRGIWNLLSELGHSIIDPVPSLFAIDTPHKGQHALSGVSVPRTSVKIKGDDDIFYGPTLITHKGLSGPAVLQLSAFKAIELKESGYGASVIIDWLPDYSENQLEELFYENRKKKLSNPSIFPLPKRLVQYLFQKNEIPLQKIVAEISKVKIEQAIHALKSDTIQMVGKSTHKEEFVTAGGVDLKNINFKNFSSKILPDVYMAGEMLNIDAVTGGFNFQAAWTGGYLIAQDILKEVGPN